MALAGTIITVFAQQQNDSVAVAHLVAPPYPRDAKDRSIQGTTITRVRVDGDGTVVAVEPIQAHPIFREHVVEALRQWRFRASGRAFTIDITCLFELKTDKCEGTDEHPITPETRVSADLPNKVRISTGLQCLVRVDR